MKLSYSIRGWNDFSWEEMLDAAQEQRFEGIELNNMHRRPELADRGAPFHRYNTAGTVRELREKKIALACIDTSCNLSAEADCMADVFYNMEIAKNAQIPYVTVRAKDDREELIRERIEKILAELNEASVTLLIKTSGIYADTARLRALLDSYASDQLGAMWDLNHTCRGAGESADTTIRNLGAYVRHVHVRDSDDNGEFTLIGEGTLPMKEFMRALSSINYDGFVSLEWKPEWMEDMQERDVIFAHYVNYMQRFENPRGMKKMLYFNHDGSGQFVWKKDELINCTFSDVLDRMAEEFPNQYAFRYTTLDYTRTYEQFRDDVDHFARALMSMGVRAGTKVAVWATNVPAWYIAFWSCVKIGAILVSMNTAYKISEAEYLLRQSDTHTLIMIESCLDSDYRSIIAELCPEIEQSKAGEALHCRRLPFLRNVVTVGFRQKGCLTFEEVMQRAHMVSPERLQQAASQVKPDDVCNLQYTSGTTGFPKGVMLTHYNVVNDGKCIGDRMDLSTADRMMIQVPMFHCFGMVLAMTAAMTHGTTLCPLPYFSAKSSLACIRQEKITCFHGVPTMFIAMLNHEDYRKTDFSHMRTGIMAGAGCPPELMRRVARADEMNMRGIVSVYGQTESAPGSTMSSWDDPLDVRCDTVGRAFPYIQCKIIDPETGLEVPDGVDGEFCSRGYNTMKGYYKMPQATHDTVDEDGWLHSGDLARRNSDGTFVITGRLKDMIIRGGENIYPKEIEEFIYTHPAVRDVQVIGVPDARYGEAVMACIILKDGMQCTAAEMKKYVQDHMARHKVPQYIEFMDAFPMNAAGKVLKYKMREAAVERLNLKGAAGIDTASSR